LWTEHKLTFPGLPMRKETRAVLHHFTGGEGQEHQVHRTLTTRRNRDTGKLLGLSVQFFIRFDGAIFQFVDADTRCAHAGVANAWSVGVEIQNRATAAANVAGIRRQLVTEEIHGRTATRSTFTAAQVHSAIALTAALTEAYDVPWRLPMDGSDVLSTAMDPRDLATFRGILGHLHITTAKVDPGLALLRAMAAMQARAQMGIAGPAQ